MVHDGLARTEALHPDAALIGGRNIGYEVAEGEKPGYFHLYRVVRCRDAEHRTLIDIRCDRKRIEEVARLWQQPGAWMNFF